MHSISITALFALAASIVNAAPAELQARTYPTVATVAADMTDVSADYLAKVATVEVNLDPSVSGRGLEARQSGTCDLQGFAIVNGQATPFQGSVQNSAANFGRAVTLTGLLAGCSIGLIPQSDCSLWSIIDTSGCATARSVTFF
ncbi:hypothetical protein N0V82_002072 [Gnomoniopsis sp. IMI 355080]|nr:hypothetical protein N0V82_002072 [Gnomoniopsis sp. IMI 355080]